MRTLLQISQYLYSLVIVGFLVFILGVISVSQQVILPQHGNQHCFLPPKIDTKVTLLVEDQTDINCVNQSVVVAAGGVLTFSDTSRYVAESIEKHPQIMLDSLIVADGGNIAYSSVSADSKISLSFRDKIEYQSRTATQNIIINPLGDARNVDSLAYLDYKGEGIVAESTNSNYSYFEPYNDIILAELAEEKLSASLDQGKLIDIQNTAVLGASTAREDTSFDKSLYHLEVSLPKTVSVSEEPAVLIEIKDLNGDTVNGYEDTIEISSPQGELLDFQKKVSIHSEDNGKKILDKFVKFYREGEYYLTFRSQKDSRVVQTVKVTVLYPSDALYFGIGKSTSWGTLSADYDTVSKGVSAISITLDETNILKATGEVNTASVEIYALTSPYTENEENPQLVFTDFNQAVNDVVRFVKGYFVHSPQDEPTVKNNLNCPAVLSVTASPIQGANSLHLVEWAVTNATAVYIDAIPGVLTSSGSAVVGSEKLTSVRLKAVSNECSITSDVSLYSENPYKSTTNPYLFAGILIVLEIGTYTLGRMGVTIASGSVISFLISLFRGLKKKQNLKLLFWDYETNAPVRYLPFSLFEIGHKKSTTKLFSTNEKGIFSFNAKGGRYSVLLHSEEWEIARQGGLSITGNGKLRGKEFSVVSAKNQLQIVIPVRKLSQKVSHVHSFFYEFSVIGPFLFLIGLILILLLEPLTLISTIAVALLSIVLLLKILLVFFIDARSFARVKLETIDGIPLANVKVTVISKSSVISKHLYSDQEGNILLFLPQSKYKLRIEDPYFNLLGKKASKNQISVNISDSWRKDELVLFPRVGM